MKEKHSQTPVNDFYKNSTILITGGTGFLGKVLIQKLLTSFDIRKIYLLIRLKNDMSLNDRIENFFNESIFKYIHENEPELFNKIHPIQVNFNANDLDILPYERDLLIDEVQIVFNVVASVKFNEKLSDAIYINVLGTKKILDLVLKMNNLKSFLHVSTLYTNCNKNHIDEAVYDVDIGYEKIIRIYNILNNERFEKLSHCLIGGMPNTYTMSKKCSENLVNHLTYNLPAGIFRAPIIMSTYKEPFPGWTDNLYGPSGLCTWSAKGFVHCLFGDANKKANLVPVDYCVNAMISCAWDIFRRYKIRIYEQTEIPVYNYIFDNNNLTWGQFMRMARKGFHEPFDKTIWYFAYFIIPSKPLHRLTTFLVHNIPGHILDLIAATTGQKKIFSKGYKKISKVIDMMSYFGLREWKFTNRNIIELDKRLKSTNEKNLLEFNMESIDWNEFFKNYLSGIRKYVMKETNDRIAEKRKIFMRLYILHLIMKSSAIFIIFLNVWKLFKKIVKRFMPILYI